MVTPIRSICRSIHEKQALAWVSAKFRAMTIRRRHCSNNTATGNAAKPKIRPLLWFNTNTEEAVNNDIRK